MTLHNIIYYVDISLSEFDRFQLSIYKNMRMEVVKVPVNYQNDLAERVMFTIINKKIKKAKYYSIIIIIESTLDIALIDNIFSFYREIHDT